MDKFVGKWKSVSAENFDNFMKEMDVGFLLRKAGAMATVYLDYQKVDETTWTLDWQIAFKKGQNRFQLGQEFDTVTADDRKIKLTPTFENGKYIEVQRGKPHDIRVERWMADNGEMHELVTILSKDVKYTRVYVRY